MDVIDLLVRTELQKMNPVEDLQLPVLPLQQPPQVTPLQNLHPRCGALKGSLKRLKLAGKNVLADEFVAKHDREHLK